MNILPKKSWHVRNKDNVAKVRKDEEEARNEEKKRLQQIALAEQEARTELLRKKAKKLLPNDSSNSLVALNKDELKPINFFQEIGPDGKPYAISAKNEEHEKEKQEEKEKAEKKIGLLTYLGQSAAETMPDDQRPWYFKPPSQNYSSDKKNSSKSETVDDKKKIALDPITEMKEHLKKKKKHKHSHKKQKTKKSSHSSNLSSKDKLAKLRKDRLEREAKEKQRSILLLQKHYGSSETNDYSSESSFVPKYSNQFNPQLARNNK